MLAGLLPDGIGVAETASAVVDGALLLQEERALGIVAEKRRREFTGGRLCARRALLQLGVAPSPILIGPNREPVWPPGIVGSITHCDGYQAAAVTRPARFASIGIDAEPHDALPADVLDLIASPDERAHFSTLGGRGIHWDRLAFSAKESVYKAWFPLTRRWLDFTDVTIAFDPGRARFRIDVLVEAPLVQGRAFDRLEGRFRIANGYVLTFFGVEADESKA